MYTHFIFLKRRQHRPGVFPIRDETSCCQRMLTPPASILQIWSTSSLTTLYVIHPYGETDAGDIYSLSFSYTPHSPSISSSPSTDRAILFFGCQNTSLQWVDLSSLIKPNGPAAASKGLHSGVTGSLTTESSSNSEFEVEFEFEDDEGYNGEINEENHHSLEDADEERQRHHRQIGDEQQRRLPHSNASSRAPSQSRHGGSKSRRLSRPPKKLHKFFDSQPRGSQTQIFLPTTLVGSSSAVNDPITVPRNTSFSSTGSLDKSPPPKETLRPRRYATTTLPQAPRPPRPRVLRVPSTNVVDSAHYGYIYCMELVPSPLVEVPLRPFGEFEPEARYTSENNTWEKGEIRLVTGSGDEDVKVNTT